MNILILTSVYPPLGHSGHDERCRQAVSALSRLGHKLQVVTSDHRLPPVGSVKEKGIFRELCLYGDSANAEVLGSNYALTQAHEMNNVQAFEYRLHRFEPDFVYVWNMRGLSKSILFRLQEMEMPVVFDLHSEWLIDRHFESDPWFKWWFRNSSTLSKGYQWILSTLGMKNRKLKALPIGTASELDLTRSYLCSESLRNTFLSAGVHGVDSLPVVYPFADETLLRPKTDYEKGSHFMWAGRVSEAKAPDLAIDAIKLLRDRGVAVKLDIFGMGEQAERKALRNEIVGKGLEGVVQMKGIRPGELREHYANYDAILFTSRFEDPFPMTVLEAMLSRLPCILANTGGVPEIVGDSENVVLFERDDASSLANAIERFLTLTDGGELMANRCIQSLRGADSFDSLRHHIETKAI